MKMVRQTVKAITETSDGMKYRIRERRNKRGSYASVTLTTPKGRNRPE